MSKLTKRANRYRRSDRLTYAWADPNYRKAFNNDDNIHKKQSFKIILKV